MNAPVAPPTEDRYTVLDTPPRRLRDVVRGIYVEGYFTARRADGTEDSTRQSHDNGFLIELQFPRNIVGRSDYAPPTNWSLDITWEP